MKFGKQMEFYKVPEWSEYYIDYVYLRNFLNIFDIEGYKKKLLNELRQKSFAIKERSYSNFFIEKPSDELELKNLNNKVIEKVNSNNLIQSFKNCSEDEKISKFKQAFIKELDKVENFFNSKFDELTNQIRNLETKIEKKKKIEIEEIIEDEDEKLRLKNVNKERDELGYATSWKRALSNLYNQTSWLHSFYSINDLAVKKLLLKIEKIFEKNLIFGTKELKKEVDQHFTLPEKLDALIGLRKKVKNIYAKEITDNNMLQASKDLDSRLGGGGKLKNKGLMFFYIGVIVTSLFFYFLLNWIPKKEEDRKMSPFFPAFNFSFVIIEVLLGVGLNVYILKKFRINYIYIFEVEPSLRLGSSEFFKSGLLMAAVWTICLLFFKLTLSFGFFDGYFPVFALIVNCSIFIFIFFPFHCSYLGYRKGIVSILFKNFFPIGKNGVKFRDFLFGDILTSLNKAFTSFILSVCLFTCSLCKEKNIRKEPGLICDRNSIACLIVSFYPFLIRFTQCLNRYYYTGDAWPHLGNTVKYIGGLSNAVGGWYYGYAGGTKKSLIVHLTAGFISQCYMYFWDVYMDWNLGRSFKKNFFLRDKIIYPKSWYYFAIISDGILRFFWLLNLINTKKFIDDEYKNFFFAVFEAYRRIQWCVFRIENENTNNPEKYRNILEIPELPID